MNAAELLRAYNPNRVGIESQALPLEAKSATSQDDAIVGGIGAAGDADTYYDDFMDGLKEFVRQKRTRLSDGNELGDHDSKMATGGASEGVFVFMLEDENESDADDETVDDAISSSDIVDVPDTAVGGGDSDDDEILTGFYTGEVCGGDSDDEVFERVLLEANSEPSEGPSDTHGSDHLSPDDIVDVPSF